MKKKDKQVLELLYSINDSLNLLVLANDNIEISDYDKTVSNHSSLKKETSKVQKVVPSTRVSIRRCTYC